MIVDKQAVLKDLDKALKDAKKELGFEASTKELYDHFELKDYFLSKGFVHEMFPRALSFCMAEYYRAWIGTLHSWFYPPQGDLIHANEAKQFDDEDRKKVKALLYQAMRFSRLETALVAKRDDKERGKLIDEMNDQLKDFNKELTVLLDKVKGSWDKDQV